MTSLRTFRAEAEEIITDPSERQDYDETTWEFHALTGLEVRKTYADNSSVVKTYDAFNRLATETDARGNVKTHSYEHARGLLLGTTYAVADGTAATASRSFSYNHLGQMIQLVDDAGTRSFSYNAYGEREGDSLVVDGDTHLVTETRDSFGRSTGYVYSRNGSVQQTVTTGYGTDGRISSASFLHGGAAKVFGYQYLSGSNLLHKLTKPNNMVLTQSYESTRDLLTGMAYHRGTTPVAQREYTYDQLGRPTARHTNREGSTVNDIFEHNSRSELMIATVNGKDYEYAYDNIGNRQFTLEDGKATMYDANSLNQYTSIAINGGAPFIPQFDADGNQTLIKTDTGIWSAVYNSENRPVTFTNSESNTVVECAYDSMGRRAYKKMTVNGSVTLHQRYIYRGYLQIACIDLTRSHHPDLWYITWDPTQPVATRPLAIQLNGTWFTYGWDLTKNICEVFGQHGYTRTTYTYTPFGTATATGDVTQPIQWSSEVWDSELGLVYYNWRYYNAMAGRWICRDMADITYNLMSYVKNLSINTIDLLGLVERCNKKILGEKHCYFNGVGISSIIFHYRKPFRKVLDSNNEFLEQLNRFMMLGDFSSGITSAAKSGASVYSAIMNTAAEMTADYYKDEYSVFSLDSMYEKLLKKHNEIYTHKAGAIFDVFLKVEECVCESHWYWFGFSKYEWKIKKEPVKRYVFEKGVAIKFDKTLAATYDADSADEIDHEGLTRILFAAMLECEYEIGA